MPWLPGMVLLGTVLLTGCASLSRDGDVGDVQTLLGGQALTAQAAVARAPDAASSKAVAALLARPLDAEAAVRIALLNNPRLQSAFATLQLSDADRVRAASLPNPVFAFSRLTEGSQREIDRVLSFNVLDLLTLPWQARWAGQRHEVAKLQAAQGVLMVAAETRRAWVRAVAAQQSLVYLRDARDAADAGAELAHRMAQAGNWSALQKMREQLLLADATTQLARAEQLALARREDLTRLLALDAGQLGYVLPDRLPALPAAVPDSGDVQMRALRDRLDVRAALAQNAATADALGLTRATSIVNALELGVVRNTLVDSGSNLNGATQHGFEISLPIPLFDWGQAGRARAEALYLQSAAQVRETGLLATSEAREALQGWRTRYDLARRYRDEIVPLRRQMNDEMLARYNGMLASVWELLAETRASVLEVNASIDAQRDFWIADTDLQMALSGPASRPAAASASVPVTPANPAFPAIPQRGKELNLEGPTP